METIKLSEEQAATIAHAIIPDIKAYINSHRKEYEEFLKEQNKKHSAKEVIT